MTGIKCPQCSAVNLENAGTCGNCGFSLPKPSRAPWRIGLYALSVFLILLGILFLWAAPVANTMTRLITGIIMIALGVIFIVLLSGGGARLRRLYPEEAEDGEWVDVSQLTCTVCGGTIGEDSLSVADEVPKLICPRCKHPYQMEEEPKW